MTMGCTEHLHMMVIYTPDNKQPFITTVLMI